MPDHDLQHLRQRLQRDVNCLRDPDRMTRRRALGTLRSCLLPGDDQRVKAKVKVKPGNGSSQASVGVNELSLRKFLVETLLSPLIELLSDPVEKCRELSAVLILDVLKCTDDEEQDTAAAAHALAPCIHHRMGSIPCTETAEELRLLLLQLLEFLWSRPSASTWGAEVADETAEVLTCALLDTFPEVKRHSCTLLSLMAGVPAGRTSLKHRTDKLLQVLASNLSHQHSKTRQMTVEGMGDVLLCGGDGADKIVREVFLPRLTQMLDDRTPAVRQTLSKVIGRVLCSLERGEVPVLMPLRTTLLSMLLTGLSDESSDVRQAALLTADEVGTTWSQQSEKNSCAAASVCSGSGAPSTRAYIISLLPELLPAALQDMAHWTAGSRKRACKLVGELVCRSGDTIATYLPELVPALCASSCDEETAVRDSIEDAAANLGASLSQPAACTDLLLPILRDECPGRESPLYYTQSLLVLRPFLSRVAAERAAPLVGPICAALSSPGLLHAPADDALVAATFRVCELLLTPGLREHLTGDVTCSAIQVFVQLLGRCSVLCAEDGEGADTEVMKDFLDDLARVNGLSDGQELVAAHFLPLLSSIVSSPGADESGGESWAADPERRRALQVLLGSSPLAASRNMDTLMPLFSSTLKDPERDPQMRLDMISMMQPLLEWREMTQAIVHRHSASLVIDILLPNLIWRVGMVASTIRKMAIACLYTLLHEGKLSRDALYETAPQLLPVLKTNLEDYDSTTRQLSCLSVAMLLEMLPGALGEDPVREMYPELLKRLDDSNDDVRRAGCNALAALFLSASPPAIQGTPLEYSVEQLLIHLDDKDTTIQEGVMKPLRVAASIDRPMVARKAAEARSNLLNPHFCDELLQAS